VFNHSITAFPLTGKHTSVQCGQCHVNNVYKGTPKTCDGCHLAKYNATTSPNHVAAGFPKTCDTCHNTTQWPGATFNHTTMTTWPLTGKHTSLQCSQCHVNNVFKGTPKTCDGCHLAKYNATTNPNHVAAGFPKDCSLCHTTAQWPGASFNHSTTAFPLTGKHTSLQCSQCHVNNVFKGTPKNCDACHLAKYNATTNPNHVSAGFPKDCSLCHNTTQWPGATFNHSSTAFPLTGKHATTQCGQCHVNNVYKGTPKDCYTCHQNVYNSATNPNHIAAGFAKTCDSCHTTTQWTGARYNGHTAFPIYSGSHSGKWTRCNDCHPNASDYKTFTCTSCHAPQSSVDRKHQGVKNYTYDSIRCYSCHPQGRAG
jgi:hypothetical protein